MTNIEFGSLIPTSASGVGVLSNTYASGRLGVALNHFGGICALSHFGQQPDESTPEMFTADQISAYTRLFRMQIAIDGAPYNLEFTDTEHFPFGYRSHFRVPELGVSVRHHLTLLNETLVFTVEVLENSHSLPLCLRMEHHDYTKKQAPGREWTAWAEAPRPGVFQTQVTCEVPEEKWDEQVRMLGVQQGVGLPTLTTGLRRGTTWITLFGTLPLQMQPKHSGRFIIQSDEFQDGAQSVGLLFSPDAETATRQVEQMHSRLPALALEREAGFTARLAALPHAEVGDQVFESFFANAPAVVESLMVEDIPGGLRASNMHYWIWGWDTVMTADFYLVTGNAQFVRDALRFYRDTADPKWGWGHCFTRQCELKLPQAPAVQCLYLIMLYEYFSYTLDKSLIEELYPFAKSIFERLQGNLNAQGLGDGPSLIPDFPEFAGHTGQDLSVFNNSILYQGARCMETLAALAGDAQTAEESRQISRRLEEVFVPTFWDEAQGYWVDSVHSETLEQRKSYPLHSLFWQTPFLTDLVAGKLENCARFIAKNLISKRGLLPFPRWDKAFDGDGNQMSQVYPYGDVWATHCLSAAGDQANLQRWMGWVDWFWGQLTIPEGYSAQTINDSGTPDAPGGKQAFIARPLYMAFLGNSLGVELDFGGITLLAGREETLSVRNLQFQGTALNITTGGAGRFPAELRVDGTEVQGTCKVPRPLLAGKPQAEITYRRSATPPTSPIILSLIGAFLETISVDTSSLRADIAGYAYTVVHFYSPFAPSVSFGGQNVAAEYNPETHIGKALLPTKNNRPMSLTILPN